MEDAQDGINKIAAAAAVAAAAAAVTSNAAIMKELSDIKVQQGKNDTNIVNISRNIDTIQSDVKEIKALYVTHAELAVFQKGVDEVDRDHVSRIRVSEKWYRYGLAGVFILNTLIGYYLIVHFNNR